MQIQLINRKRFLCLRSLLPVLQPGGIVKRKRTFVNDRSPVVSRFAHKGVRILFQLYNLPFQL